MIGHQLPAGGARLRPPRTPLRRDAFCAILTTVVLVGTVGMGAAHADTASDYAELNAPRICNTLDRYPTYDAIIGIGTAIVDEGQLSYYEAGRAIKLSVIAMCPQHLELLNKFVAWASTAQQKQAT